MIIIYVPELFETTIRYNEASEDSLHLKTKSIIDDMKGELYLFLTKYRLV
jgi:hypothetical protein